MLMKARSNKFPRMIKLEQKLYQARLGDEGIIGKITRDFEMLGLADKVGNGKTVAIGAGSRGIASIDLVIKTIVGQVSKAGGIPFVFPAMGSHGGGTDEGQLEMLATLNITPESIGCPIKSSMAVVELGRTADGRLPIYLDKHASEADAIIVVNRIKPHTNFRGEVESGLMKMLAIGAGKHAQAVSIHTYGTQGLRDYMPEIAQLMLERANIVAGFALLEDGYHNLTEIRGVLPAYMRQTEATLLTEARNMMPKLPLKNIDLLIVEQIGKNISGTGMDTNIVGRCRLIDLAAFPEPNITAIIALDLTDETHGNAIGMGLADIVTRRLANKIDYKATYINALTGQGPQQAALPIVAESDQEAIRLALDYMLGTIEVERARVVRIKNTLAMDTLEVSEPLWQELQGQANISFVGQPFEMQFKADGTLS